MVQLSIVTAVYMKHDQYLNGDNTDIYNYNNSVCTVNFILRYNRYTAD